jgi:integrase
MPQMPIRYDKRNKCWRFEFDRVIEGRRHRLSKLLPVGWSQAEADAFDRKEGARLYAVATGVRQRDPLIDEAVVLFVNDKRHLKGFKSTVEHLNAIAYAYHGKPMSELPAVAKLVCEEATWKPATVKQRLAWLKAACRWAWKQHNLTEHDPTARMQLPPVKNERHVYLTRREMLTLAWATQSHAVRILMRTAFYTGLRLGEVARVEVAGDLLHLADSKNGSRRSVPVHVKIRTCLDYLPLSMPRSTLHKYLKAARETTGIQGNTFHDLRHSTASELINAGVDLFTVGAVLGHKDARSTQRYSHLSAGTLANAIGKIGQRQKTPHKPDEKGAKKAA